jgi:hypothetical protein
MLICCQGVGNTNRCQNEPKPHQELRQQSVRHASSPFCKCEHGWSFKSSTPQIQQQKSRYQEIRERKSASKIQLPKMASDLSSIPTSFATCSIGAGSDPLEKKLRAIASGGFQGIELAFPDLLTFANSQLKREVQETDYESICEAGKEVKKLCSSLNLKIVMLQPFANYEGWSEGSKEKKDALDRAKGWIRVMEAVGTDMLQVGSSDSPAITSDRDALAKDLGVLADMLSEKGFRLAYENWCWYAWLPTC